MKKIQNYNKNITEKNRNIKELEIKLGEANKDAHDMETEYIKHKKRK